MGTHFKRGFTIIETMLVLAITGVLIAGLLIGVGSSVSAQRYKDSVATFKSLLQDQYSQVTNVSNDRNSNWTCGSTADPAQSNGGIAPGQSDCVLLGRYVSIVGGSITQAVVVGFQNSKTAGASDIATIKANYTLGISTSSIATSSLEWGAQIAWPAKGSGAKKPTMPRSLAMLILRSPDSGTSYTFTSDDVNDIIAVNSATLKTMMVEDTTQVPGQLQRTICIDPNGVGVPEMLAVYIGQAADGPGSIETRSFSTITNNGGDSQC
ncbi:MAG: hypothetical protein JWO99_39 [Candidatus Saccharibacteria bacterium]|nr:hypothetical protein [Candidatus Saccharibacteria bacterium]